MPLSVGRRFGPYEIVAPLGSGGMGEVYRARDTTLHREVAVKTLPDTFASDPDRLARLKREAQALAALNHPNIAAIYGFEERDGVHALVLELVDGSTLAERIARGPIPVEEALRIARQMADALDAAHEHGIVHRDLKPANVKLRDDATVKVLDFGLAKLIDAGAASAADAVSQSPTLSAAATRAGVILGTAAYMSPEQARGKVVDKRTDIWAFGCVLYEMLTGRRAFDGEDVTDVLSRILQREPDLAVLPTTTPRSVRRLLNRALQKDPRVRMRDMGDVRAQLDEPEDDQDAAPSASRVRGAAGVAASVLVAAALASLATWWMMRSSTPPSDVALHASIALPDAALPLTILTPDIRGSGSFASTIAISPDGTHVVYTARAGDRMQLYVRPLGQPEVSPIDGAEGGSPFFSPDGQWVAFFGDGQLKKVPVGGGAALTVCDAAFGYGGVWLEDDTIVFAGTLQGGLLRVPAAGGQPEAFTTLAEGEGAHRWPTRVPGTRDVVFAAASGFNWDAGRIAIQSLDERQHRVLFERGFRPQYLGTGHMAFARAGSLFVIPFDAAGRVTSGTPRRVLQGLSTFGLSGTAQYAVSANGTLVYLPGGEEDVRRSFVWVDRQGREEPISTPPRGFEDPRLAPDGSRIAVTIREGDADVWVVDPGRGTLTRLTTEEGEDHSPVWTPDGTRVTYSSSREARSRIRQKSADGSGAEEELFISDSHRHLVRWADARTLLTVAISSSGADLRTMTAGTKVVDAVYVKTVFNDADGRLSFDSRWVAYTSNESGRAEIYVQAFPMAGGRVQVSTNGGNEPVWARSGRELFYREGGRMMAVTVDAGTSFKAAIPRVLFSGDYVTIPWGEAHYDVSLDDRRFLMLRSEAQPPAKELRLVVNWTGSAVR